MGAGLDIGHCNSQSALLGDANLDNPEIEDRWLGFTDI